MMAVNNSLATTWRGLFRLPQVRFRGLVMTSEALSDLHQFIWKQGRDVVVLIKEEDAWKVSYSTDSKLLGPRRLVYQASHRVAKHAAWDVMARVISASHNEDEGLRAAKQAAQWMRRLEASRSARA